MGLGVFLFIVAVIVFASVQEQVDLKCLRDDYQEGKKNRR
jgi:hypothetical protein